MNAQRIELDVINIASPCSADWNQMQGTGRVRFCGECQLRVYNLSEMHRSEAEDLLIQHEGRLCVRFYRRSDGTLLTRDCPVGLSAARRRVGRMIAATAALAGFIVLGGWCSRAGWARSWQFPRLPEPLARLAGWVDPPPIMGGAEMGDVAMGAIACPAPPVAPPPTSANDPAAEIKAEDAAAH